MKPLVPLLLAAAALAAGCRSVPELEVRRLPVHVAIVPIAAPTVGAVTPGEFEGTETDLRLDLDGEEVSRAVAQVLEQYCFTRVSLLETERAPGTERAEGQDGALPIVPVDAFERERALLAQADACGADWILELGLRYDAEVYRQNASTFWLNWPLFLFAAPSNWFIPDIDYLADVELTARIYDLNALAAAGGSLGDPVAEVITVGSRFGGTELPFVDRSEGLIDYATGVLIPSGFLARESEEAGAALRAEILSALEVQLVQGIQSRRDALVQSAPIAPFFVEPGEVEILREGAGLRVRGRALLRADSVADRVRAVELDAGAGPVRIEAVSRAEAVPGGYRSFHFEGTVPTGPGSRWLRLACEAGTRDSFVRSYTFRIPAARTPPPVQAP